MSSDPQDQNPDFAELMGGGIVRHQHDKADLANQRRSNRSDSSYRRQAAAQDDQQLADGLSDEIRQLVDPEQELIHATNGVQLKLMKKLRQGHLPWQAGLDLHGYNVDQARDELSRFIRDSARNDYRCVLVVHGKALKHEQAPAVLKSYVNDWLRQLPQVLAFVSAQPKDGGTGALYVLLKRAK
jgi:DNA-nicking Smr family endonuclease